MRRMFWAVSLLFVPLCMPVTDLGAQEVEAQGPRFMQIQEGTGTPMIVEPEFFPLLRERVTVLLDRMALGAALDAISEDADVRFIFNPEMIPLDRRVSLVAEGMRLVDVLVELLRGTGVDVIVSERQIGLFHRSLLTAETDDASIRGIVRIAGTGTPLASAQVVLDGVHGTMTDDQGAFIFSEVAPGEHTVQAALIGYKTETVRVLVQGGRVNSLNFELEVTPTQLSELVVTATGEERRRVEIGNDIVVINADSIVAREPITSVTDLLEGRVPGLVVLRSSGAPGDPARIRIRGASSPSLSNDPIIVVDGIRVYSEQSGSRGGNLAQVVGGGAPVERFAAPSPLDYIDPHSIETIQVVKGPAASTMYGQDAANGVIVVTTKRGRPGQTRWTMNMDYGQSRMAGEFPTRYLQWGRVPTDSRRVHCPLSGFVGGIDYYGRCVPDGALETFQALNDPNLSVLDRGQSSAVNVGVSGGGAGLTYSLGANYGTEDGIVALSRYEMQRYRADHGVTPPDWMQRPQNLTQWGMNSRIGAQLGQSVNITLSSRLSRTEQRRSDLERNYDRLADVYVDPLTGGYLESGDGVSGLRPSDANTAFYRRVTARSTQFMNGLNVNWQAIPGLLTIDAVAGLDVVQRADDIFLPSGVDFTATFTADGELRRAQGTSIVNTWKIDARSQLPIGLGFRLGFNTGISYSPMSTEDVFMRLDELPEGVSMITGGTVFGGERRDARSTFGWYIAPSINHRRMWLTTGLRLDGGSSFGTRVKLPTFPKLDFSYLISDEPYFPDVLGSFMDNLRLRVAYGHAGRQPGPVDRLRLYRTPSITLVDGRLEEAVSLHSLGNTELRPERSKELEGGFEADLFDYRVSVGLTGYTKTTDDALMQVNIAPSVYGEFTQFQNIGVIRNAGFELTLDVEPVRRDFATWRIGLNLSQNRNEVLEMGEGVEPFYTEQRSAGGQNNHIMVNGIRVAPGYPLFGRWRHPVLGYADANGDGVLQEHEVVFGDTAVYVGTTLPEFTGSLRSSLSLFRGQLSITAGLLFDTGMTQWNMGGSGRAFSYAWNHTSASLSEQLYMLHQGTYARIETVNSLRLNSLSVRWQVPSSWAGRVGANALDLSLQGTNLALWTNYSGLDPNVNSSVSPYDVRDGGVLPAPRRWQLRLSAAY